MRPIPAVCQPGAADDDDTAAAGEPAADLAPGASCCWALGPRIWFISCVRAALPTDAMAELGTEKLVCVDEAAETVVPLDADGPPAAFRCCGRDSKYLSDDKGTEIRSKDVQAT